MKKFLLSFIISCIIFSNALSYKEDKTKSVLNKENLAHASYTIGYSIGKNINEQLIKQNILLNCTHLQQGFTDGIKANKPKLNQETMEESMQSFQQYLDSIIDKDKRENYSNHD